MEERYAPRGEPLRFGVEHETVMVDPKNPGVGSGSLELVRRLAHMPGVTPKLDSGAPVEVRHDEWPGIVTTDAGKSVLEVAYHPTVSVHEFERASTRFMNMLVLEAKAIGHRFLGVGRHPDLADPHWVDKQRYHVLRGWLIRGGNETCETASHQVTVDARSPAHLLAMLNAGNALSGPIAALFANAGIYHGAVHPTELASRVRTWQRICPEPERVGIPLVPFATREGYVDWLVGRSYFLHMFENGMAESHRGTVWTALQRYGIEHLPRILAVQIGTVWSDARWRLNKIHSVEYRVPCRQRQGEDDLACTAFILGLAESSELICERVVGMRPWAWWRHFRRLCAKFALDAVYDGIDVKDVLRSMLGYAYDALVARGLGEEVYLEPLERRLETGITPAQEAFPVWARGGMHALIEDRQYRYDYSAAAGDELVNAVSLA